jgi:hypothetical protein
MIVYKIVRVLNDRLISWAPIPRTWHVTYIPDKWVTGIDGTPVFAFDTYWNAHVYLYRPYQLWEAETRSAQPIAQVGLFLYIANLAAWWARPESDRFLLTPAVQGTVACDGLKLLRRLE